MNMEEKYKHYCTKCDNAPCRLVAESAAMPTPLTKKERFKLARVIKDFLFEQCNHERDRNYDWCPECVMNFMELGGWVATLDAEATRTAIVYTDFPDCGIQMELQEVL